MAESSTAASLEAEQRALAVLINRTVSVPNETHIDDLLRIRETLATDLPLAEFFKLPVHERDFVAHEASNKDVLDEICQIVLGEDLFELRFAEFGHVQRAEVICNLRNCIYVLERIREVRQPERLLDYFLGISAHESAAPELESLRREIALLLDENNCLRERLGGE